MRANRMKDKIRAGEPAFGVSMMIPSPQLVEMVGRLGFDWVLIDCEHGTISLETVELMVMAAEASGLTPIGRPWRNSDDAILRLLDRGVMGVQVPHVNTAADAQRAVEAVKYHPLGTRGLAAGTRPAGYGLGVSPAAYAEWANRQTLVCVQLEETEALRNIDEILRVQGVDVFFVGPSDLSQSMGYPGQTGHPEVRAAIDGAFAAIVAAGKAPGSAGGSEAIVDHLQKGCLYVYTHVPKLLSSASAAFFEAVRGVSPGQKGAGRAVSKIDFKRTMKALYAPSRKAFSIVDVPPMQFLMIDGHGDPNTAPAYQEAVEALYAVAYRCKFVSKRALERDYVVPPLEGLWWAAEMDAFSSRDKSAWDWTMMIMQPEWVTGAMMDEARVQAGKELPATVKLRLETYHEGLSVQILHVGSYDDEAPTIARMHSEFMPAHGLIPAGKHHEIYLSDPRRVAPEKLKTVLRQPVRKAG